MERKELSERRRFDRDTLSLTSVGVEDCRQSLLKSCPIDRYRVNALCSLALRALADEGRKEGMLEAARICEDELERTRHLDDERMSIARGGIVLMRDAIRSAAMKGSHD